MTTYLLDLNLLLALTTPTHIHHEIAHRWFASTGSLSWATCPITENGFVRVASNPNYPNSPGEASVVLALLRLFCAHSGHKFWADEISIRHFLPEQTVYTQNQITDLYLLGLAAANDGKLATLDQKIPATLIPNGNASLELLLPGN